MDNEERETLKDSKATTHACTRTERRMYEMIVDLSLHVRSHILISNYNAGERWSG